MADTRDLGTLLEEGPDDLRGFLTAWYGPPDRTGVRPPEMRGGPRALRRWFELAAQWRTPIAEQNQILRPDETWDDQGKRVFWVENQGVWLWAYDREEDDPLVYDRENEHGHTWQPTGCTLSAFLVRIAVFEAIWNGPHGAAANELLPDQCDAVLHPLRSLPIHLGRWPAEGARVYAGVDVLAHAGPFAAAGEPLHDESWFVFISGRTPEALRYLDDIPGIQWDALWNL